MAPGADLEVRSARLDFARPMNTFGYSAIIANNGPEAAQNVEVLVLLPPGATARNAEPCIGSEMREPQGLVRCELGTLRPGEERRVFMLVLTAEPHPQMTTFAVSDTPDSNAANNAMDAGR
jgi:hypothetical protein